MKPMTILGGLLTLGGAAWLAFELKDGTAAAHTPHLVGGYVIGGIGLLLLPSVSDTLAANAQKILGVIGPYLPFTKKGGT